MLKTCKKVRKVDFEFLAIVGFFRCETSDRHQTCGCTDDGSCQVVAAPEGSADQDLRWED